MRLILCAICCFWLGFGGFLVQSVSVSPKLEFIDENQKENMAPKIQGVRVIVDTSKISSKIGDSEGHVDDKTETIKINTNGSGKVGIRTDITFELSDDKNGTKSEGKEAGSEDGSDVPVVRSGGGVIYADEGEGRDAGNVNYNNNNNMHTPVYHGTNDESAGTWVNFFPVSSTWTTERSFLTRQNDQDLNTGFIPYTVNDRSFKPCVCANDQPPSWKVNGISRRSFAPQTRRMIRVDDKLEYPFSNSEKRKKK